MSLRKVLSSSGIILARNVTPLRKNTGDMVTRSCIIATPPRKRIPFQEKVVLGIMLVTGVVTVPIYVLTHVQKYQGRKD